VACAEQPEDGAAPFTQKLLTLLPEGPETELLPSPPEVTPADIIGRLGQPKASKPKGENVWPSRQTGSKPILLLAGGHEAGTTTELQSDGFVEATAGQPSMASGLKYWPVIHTGILDICTLVLEQLEGTLPARQKGVRDQSVMSGTTTGPEEVAWPGVMGHPWESRPKGLKENPDLEHAPGNMAKYLLSSEQETGTGWALHNSAPLKENATSEGTKGQPLMSVPLGAKNLPGGHWSGKRLM